MANIHWASIPFFQIKTLFLGGFNLLLNDHINPNLATSFVVSHQISAALGETFFSQVSVSPVWLTPVSLPPWLTSDNCPLLLLFQTRQHGSCAGLPCAAEHWGNHGLRARRQHPLGKLAKHKHGAGCEGHGCSPQCPWAIYILSKVSVQY